jgi:hypothetical protein
MSVRPSICKISKDRIPEEFGALFGLTFSIVIFIRVKVFSLKQECAAPVLAVFSNM